jgi:multiple sugar transport system substrate-binding protein
MTHRFVLRAALACWFLIYTCGASGTSRTAEASEAPRNITVWTRAAFSAVEAQVIRDAAASFNSSQRRYKVEVQALNYRDYHEWVHSLAVTGTLPCVLEMDGPLVAEFAWPGYLRPLDGFISAQMRSDLLPSILAQGLYNGHIYSLGQFDSGLGLWANRRHLAAAGLRVPTVERPWTLAEFEDAMTRLARVQGVSHPLDLALYTGTTEFFSYAYLPILLGFGGDFIDRKTHRRASGVIDGPQSVAAMKRFQSWFQKGWASATYEKNDDFEKGRNSLLWSGHWRYAELRRALGDDLVLLPLPDFGRGLKTGMGSLSWGITSTCPDPAGAWGFLSHLLSANEILRMTSANGAVPARRSALSRSELYGPGRPLQLYVQQLFSGAGVPRPATPGYSVITRSFAKAVEAIIAGQDVQAALTRAAHAIDEDIAAHREYGE